MVRAAVRSLSCSLSSNLLVSNVALLKEKFLGERTKDSSGRVEESSLGWSFNSCCAQGDYPLIAVSLSRSTEPFH